MNINPSSKRLIEKSALHAIQVELQQGYSLSPVEAMVLAQRLEELIDEQSGWARQQGQITYQAIDIDEPPGKPLSQCRKVPVHLTLVAEGDAELWATEGPVALRRVRVHRLIFEALAQRGALSQEDLACVLGVSLKTIQRIFAYYREQDERLPSRGEIQDMGRGVSHKIPVIRKYVQDLSFSRISQHLGKHGIPSMARYLHHFALVMVLEDHGLTSAQMQSVVGISENLIQQYRVLYAELNVPEYQRTLERLKRIVFHSRSTAEQHSNPSSAVMQGEKGGQL
jgi:transcription initiation factor IIE alpha subunit